MKIVLCSAPDGSIAAIRVSRKVLIVDIFEQKVFQIEITWGSGGEVDTPSRIALSSKLGLVFLSHFSGQLSARCIISGKHCWSQDVGAKINGLRISPSGDAVLVRTDDGIDVIDGRSGDSRFRRSGFSDAYWALDNSIIALRDPTEYKRSCIISGEGEQISFFDSQFRTCLACTGTERRLLMAEPFDRKTVRSLNRSSGRLEWEEEWVEYGGVRRFAVSPEGRLFGALLRLPGEPGKYGIVEICPDSGKGIGMIRLSGPEVGGGFEFLNGGSFAIWGRSVLVDVNRAEILSESCLEFIGKH